MAIFTTWETTKLPSSWLTVTDAAMARPLPDADANTMLDPGNKMGLAVMAATPRVGATSTGKSGGPPQKPPP